MTNSSTRELREKLGKPSRKEEVSRIVITPERIEAWKGSHFGFAVDVAPLLERGIVVKIGIDDDRELLVDLPEVIREVIASGEWEEFEGLVMTDCYELPFEGTSFVHVIDIWFDRDEAVYECTFAVPHDLPVWKDGVTKTVREWEAPRSAAWEDPEDWDWQGKMLKRFREDEEAHLGFLVRHARTCPDCKGKSRHQRRAPRCTTCNRVGFVLRSNEEFAHGLFSRDEVLWAGKAQELLKYAHWDQEPDYLATLAELYLKAGKAEREVYEAAWQAVPVDRRTELSLLVQCEDSWKELLTPRARHMMWQLMKEFSVGFFRDGFPQELDTPSIVIGLVDFDEDDFHEWHRPEAAR